MSDGMRRELVYLSSYATNRYFIPNWGIELFSMQVTSCLMASLGEEKEEMKQEDARSKEFGGFFDSESIERTYGESIWEE